MYNIYIIQGLNMNRYFPQRDNVIKQFIEDANFNGISVFDEKSLYNFLDENRSQLKMKSFSLNKFIAYLADNSFLEKFEFKNNLNDKEMYTSKYFHDKSDYAKALEISYLLLPKSYLSHFSSLYYYNLTQQLPKKIYLSVERNAHAPTQKLEQSVINKALCKDARIVKPILSLFGYEIYQLHSKEANRTGIKRVHMYDKEYRITTIERTLVDIVVRSELSGGAEEIINVYKQAFKEYKKEISINKIVFILKKLDYIYPYHQVVGYLLSKSGFDATKIKKEFVFENDFFLTRGDINSNLSNLDYDYEFRIYIPKVLAKII